MKPKIDESLKFIESTTDIKPSGVLILGTGLHDSVAELDQSVTIPYSQIPHFPVPGVTSHAGDLLVGRWNGYPLAVMRGRLHFYEGFSMSEVTYPLRVLNALGADTLVVTNAAGALNVHYRVGDVVIISDHINLMGVNPLRGFTDEDSSPTFPTLNQTYNPELIHFFSQACILERILPGSGVYVAVAGPSLETPAELRFLHTIGGDLVGMSTVPETVVAALLGMRTLGISVVSNLALFHPQSSPQQSVEDIASAAAKTAPKLKKVFKRFFKRLADES